MPIADPKASVPANPVAAPASTSSITVTWDEVTAETIDGYHVYRAQPDFHNLGGDKDPNDFAVYGPEYVMDDFGPAFGSDVGDDARSINAPLHYNTGRPGSFSQDFSPDFERAAWQLVGTVASGTEEFTDTGLTADRRYIYHVRSYIDDTVSYPSTFVWADTSAAGTTATHTTDALVLETLAVTHTTDALLRGTFIVVHTTDALLEATFLLAHTTDALLQAPTGQVFHTTDALVEQTLTEAHTTDALLVEHVVLAHTTDALLVEHVALTHTTDALLQDTLTVVHTTDAVLVVAGVLTHTTDAYLVGVAVTRTHTTDAYLMQDVAITVDVTMNIDVSVIIGEPAPPVLQSQGPPSSGASSNAVDVNGNPVVGTAAQYRTKGYRKGSGIVRRP